MINVWQFRVLLVVAHLILTIKLVIDSTDSLVVVICEEFSLIQLIEALHKIEVFVAGEVRRSSIIDILNQHEDLQVT